MIDNKKKADLLLVKLINQFSKYLSKEDRDIQITKLKKYLPLFYKYASEYNEDSIDIVKTKLRTFNGYPVYGIFTNLPKTSYENRIKYTLWAMDNDVPEILMWNSYNDLAITYMRPKIDGAYYIIMNYNTPDFLFLLGHELGHIISNHEKSLFKGKRTIPKEVQADLASIELFKNKFPDNSPYKAKLIRSINKLYLNNLDKKSIIKNILGYPKIIKDSAPLELLIRKIARDKKYKNSGFEGKSRYNYIPKSAKELEGFVYSDNEEYDMNEYEIGEALADLMFSNLKNFYDDSVNLSFSANEQTYKDTKRDYMLDNIGLFIASIS